MTEEYESGMFGLWEYKHCSECEQTEDQQSTDLGKKFGRKAIGLGITSLGLGALTGSGELIIGGMALSVPVAYFWAKSEIDEE